MTSIKHVRARRNHCARRKLGIIGSQKPTFARIHMLISLRRKGGHLTEIPRPNTAPFRSHRMGAILDQADIIFGTDRQQLVHIGNMTPHIR